MYDTIQPSNVKKENGLSQPKKTEDPKNNKCGVNPNRQKKHSVPNAQDIAPPLPERNSLDDNNDDNQIYSKPKREAKEDLYSKSTNADVLYSMVKETQFNQKNMVKTSTPDVLYAEVKCLPSALGHLQSSSQSLNQEAIKLSLDTRTPRLLNSLKEHSECEVMEMRFATSIQTVNSKTLSGPFLCGTTEKSGSPFLYANVPSHSDTGVYEQIPFRVSQSTSEYQSLDQISNYSVCSTNTYDHTSTRTSKEVTSREINRKVALTNTAEDNAYETVTRDFVKQAGKKQNIAKVEKPKRFFFGDKKK
ncbi:uncharacterized protein LOC142150747 [Mixophyes fleayi]|uniref:uncharacterized protein LOC142150747 n=1 Tax=Mixophyes fleayi TaxID=3061075 RepID=UPI003F4E003D